MDKRTRTEVTHKLTREQIQQILQVVRALEGGYGDETRDMLLRVAVRVIRESNVSPFAPSQFSLLKLLTKQKKGKALTSGAAFVPMSLDKWIKKQEKQFLSEQLAFFGGNVGRTAEGCGIGVRTLSRKMGQYGLDPKVFKKKAARGRMSPPALRNAGTVLD